MLKNYEPFDRDATKTVSIYDNVIGFECVRIPDGNLFTTFYL